MESEFNKRLYQLIKELKIVDDTVLDMVWQESVEKNIDFDDLLIRRDLVDDSSLGMIVADFFGKQFINLNEIFIDRRALLTIPENVARHQLSIIFKIDDSFVYLATSQPNNNLFFQMIEKKTGKKLKVYYANKVDILRNFSNYHKELKEIIDEIVGKLQPKGQPSDARDGLKAEVELPIIKIVDSFIDQAIYAYASDIHIEPLNNQTLIRYRIDGVLHDMAELPIEYHSLIISRIKVMAGLRTDEHQEPQDGKISYQNIQENLDIRVSTAPLTRGEKVVLRLLSESSKNFSLRDLGINDRDLKEIEKAYELPNGMILSTGPTGSGKTTTLYSILKMINKRDVNIMTIEDPVEYQIETINQIQVNNRADITFAKGLRSIVRQDPDVILVGEIRDQETAGIAVNSAMTGHLVLSSLHTNDSTTTFPRLIDMGIESYLVASSVKVVVSQRLVRKICGKCRISKNVETSSLDENYTKYLKGKEKLSCYVGKGCDVCRNSGYSGRVGIFEILLMSDDLNQAIIDKKSSQELRKIAIENGMRTMIEDGLEKVKRGVTTLDEIIRVTTD
jgi:type IV pilus assembly protein PilB